MEWEKNIKDDRQVKNLKTRETVFLSNIWNQFWGKR